MFVAFLDRKVTATVFFAFIFATAIYYIVACGILSRRYAKHKRKDKNK